MTFWGVEVKPGKPFTLNSEELGGSLILTQATLGISSSSKRSILQVNVGDKQPIFLCSLLPEKSECFTLNLEFNEEEDVKFSVVGPTSIHLSGYVQRHDDDGEDDDDCELDCCAEDIAETESEDSEFDSEDEDEDEDNFIDDDDMPMYPTLTAPNSGVVIEEIEEDDAPEIEKVGNKKAKKKKELPASKSEKITEQDIVAKLDLLSEDEDGFPKSSSGNVESRKLQENTGSKTADKGKSKGKKNDAKDDGESATNLKQKVDVMDQDQEPKSDAIDGDASEGKKKKNKKKKKAKTEKDETVADGEQSAGEVANVKKEEQKLSEAVKETKESKDKPSKVRTYSNGLVVEEMEMGKPNGKRASPGKKVSVRYIGKLKKTGKIFDSSTGKSPPFKFRLGVGQVIKGWDVGVEGMRVGDKRRLTIPPSMGYGSTGARPDIPPNAWLVFDVELVDVA